MRTINTLVVIALVFLLAQCQKTPTPQNEFLIYMESEVKFTPAKRYVGQGKPATLIQPKRPFSSYSPKRK